MSKTRSHPISLFYTNERVPLFNDHTSSYKPPLEESSNNFFSAKKKGDCPAKLILSNVDWFK